MAGKTISMHASEETARRLEHVARVEDTYTAAQWLRQGRIVIPESA